MAKFNLHKIFYTTDANTPSPIVSVALTTTETNTMIRLANALTSNSSCQAMYANDNWQVMSSMTQNFSQVVSSSDGTKKVCAWIKDAAGNVSVFTPVEGTTGINMDTIFFSSGNPPTISAFDVFNNTGGADQGKQKASLNDPLKITYSIADVEGLDNNPIYLEYTTNGSVWIPIESGYGGLTGNPVTFTGEYVGFVAPSSSFFRVRLRVKDAIGNSSIEFLSRPFNTSPWSVIAGSNGRAIGGSGKSAYVYRSSSNLPNMAISPITGDVFYVDNGYGIFKVSASNGLVSQIIRSGSETYPASGTLSTAYQLPTSGTSTFFDNSGFLYLVVVPASNVTGSSAKVLRVNPNTLEYTTYLSGGLVNDNTATPSTVDVMYGAGFAFDESNTLYFISTCQPGIDFDQTSGSTHSLRLMKVTQKADGSADTVSVVAGNCVRGNPIAGADAVSNPFTNSIGTPYAYYIAVKNNGNTIYYSHASSGVNLTKIISGKTYSTSITSAIRGSAHFSPVDGKLYIMNGTLRVYNPNTAGNNGESEIASKQLLGNGALSGCNENNTDRINFCGTPLHGNLNSAGQPFFIDGQGLGIVSLRYIDENDKVQTLVGSKSFSGHDKAPSIAKGNFGAIYYKKASEPLSTEFPEGLYFTETRGGAFGYFDLVANKTYHLWGDQSGRNVTFNTAIDRTKSMGNTASGGSGDLRAFTFDGNGQPWFKLDSQKTVMLDANKTVTRVETTPVTSSYWHLATPTDNPRLFGTIQYGHYQNMTYKDDAKFFFIGVYYSPSNGFTDNKPRIKIFNYENNTVQNVWGDQTPAYVANYTGSLLTQPISLSCLNQGCPIYYHQGTDRLFVAEGVHMKYITDPENPANHVMVEMFNATGDIRNFTVSPDGKYVFYVRNNGSLYCHAISSADNSAICKNTYGAHINLGPPSGLIPISTGTNQFAWKDNSTLYISTFNDEIYEYKVQH